MSNKKFAFVFPGQGSQAIGMLQDFADHPVVRQAVTEASDALGQDLGKLMAEGPTEELNLTTNTQPVMLTAAVAFYRAWLAAGGSPPVLVAGHSLGEYSALVAAGAIRFADAVPLVRYRAQVMQEAVPIGQGGMAAILGLDDEAVRAACQEAAQGEIVEPVNFNAPAQVVIAGQKEAVERACAVAKAKGAKRALPLPVSAPFHSSLMKPAADKLAAYLDRVEIVSPDIPVLNNVDVALPASPADIKDALVRQAWRPVRWVETVSRIAAEGVGTIVECGPGKVLAGLAKRIDGNLAAYALVDQNSLQQIREVLQ